MDVLTTIYNIIFVFAKVLHHYTMKILKYDEMRYVNN